MPVTLPFRNNHLTMMEHYSHRDVPPLRPFFDINTPSDRSKISSMIPNSKPTKFQIRSRQPSARVREATHMSTIESTNNNCDSSRLGNPYHTAPAEEEADTGSSFRKLPKISKKMPAAFGGMFQKSSGSIKKYDLL